MKKTFKIILLVFSIFLSYLLVNAYERYDNLKYFRYLERSSGSFYIDDQVELSKEQINELVVELSKLDVLLTKTVYYEDSRSVYLAGNKDKIHQLFKEYDIQLDINSFESASFGSFIATYDTEDLKQIHNTKDFMLNDKIRLYRLLDIADSGGYVFGNYYLDYSGEDILKINQIIDEIIPGLIIEDIGESSMIISSNMYVEYVLILITILIIFMIMSSVFMVYQDSKKISIMTLQGYKKRDILLDFTHSNNIFIIIVYVFIQVIMILSVKNISLEFVILYTLSYLLLLITYNFISWFSLLLIMKTKSIIGALKQGNFTDKVFFVNTSLKIFVGVILLVLSYNVAEKGTELYDIYSANKDFRSMENIAVHDGYRNISSEDTTFFKRSNSFFQSLEHEDINLIVSYFNDYTQLEATDNQLSDPFLLKLYNEFITQIENKEVYILGVVDRNYLINDNIEVYDKKGKRVDLRNTLTERIYLIPESRLDQLDYIRDYSYKNAYAIYLKEQGISYEFDYYIYKERSFNIYTPYQIQGNKVESPIIQLVDYATSTSFDELGGISVAGGGQETYVKFILEDAFNKKAVYDKQLPFLKIHDLEELMPLMNFKTYGEMYGQESNIALASLVTIFGLTLSLFFIYMMITIQQVKLYSERTRKVSNVKKILGYRSFEFYKDPIVITLGGFFASLVFSSIYSIFKNITIHSTIIITFIIVEIFIVYISVKIIEKENTVLALKGDS